MITFDTSINVSTNDLLGRSTEHLYTDEAKNLIRDKVVLVTGAGGSIGSEIVRQLTSLQAKKIYCLDQDEYSLYRLQLELQGGRCLQMKLLYLPILEIKH